MTIDKIYLSICFIILLFSSCTTQTLNGHYHLIWGKNEKSFQSWNIRNNRMVINEEVCIIPDSCFTSIISFKKNIVTIDPWVDITFNAIYDIGDNGTLTMYDNNDTLLLVPHFNCLPASKYFTNKTRHLSDSFNLSYENMTGIAEFPKNYQNELIIGGSNNSTFYIFNDKELKQNVNGEFGIKKTKGENVWVHVDQHISVQNVLPIIKELFNNGYLIYFSTIEKNENNEQIKLMNRTIKHFKTTTEGFEIDYCEFCSKHPSSKIDSIVNIKMIGTDLYIVKDDTNNLFQTNNNLVQYITQNRNTRLNTQIQIEIDGIIPFNHYLTLIDELRWAHIEVSDIRFYQGKDDPDANWIKEKQVEQKSNEILEEFPMRIKEIIKITDHYLYP